jgi:hypothetical protein
MLRFLPKAQPGIVITFFILQNNTSGFWKPVLVIWTILFCINDEQQQLMR